MENELEQWWMDVTSNIPMEVRVSSTWDDHAKYYIGKVAERETQAFNAGIEAAVKLIPFVGCCSEDEALFDQAKEAIGKLKQ